MSQPVLLKVYATFAPVSPALLSEAGAACANALGVEGDQGPFVYGEGDALRVSFEGIHFPVDDMLPILEKAVALGASGKLDVLDMENWLLTRHEARNGRLERHTVPLNHVLDHSGL